MPILAPTTVIYFPIFNVFKCTIATLDGRIFVIILFGCVILFP